MSSNENEWFEIKKIDPTTYAICEHGHWEKMNSYLLIGSEEALLIDTGLGIGNIKQLVDKITNLPIMVVSTHVHQILLALKIIVSIKENHRDY
jgi:ABC-type taurine transport system substrate-binding protein